MVYSISLTILPPIPVMIYACIILSWVDSVGVGGLVDKWLGVGRWLDYVRIMLILVQLQVIAS